MARSRVPSPSSLLAFLLVFVALACGGRTGDSSGGGLIASGGGGFPGDSGLAPGAGGNPGNGGRRATGGYSGYAAYPGYGGYAQGAYPGYGGYAAYPGYGGYAQGAYPGYGGYGAYPGYGGYGAYPGYGGYGAYPGSCSYPTCQCSDCVSQCECNGIPNKGVPPSYCYDACYGAGGFGGNGQDAGPAGCSYPTCQFCPDCVSRCTCSGTDYNSCYNACYGAGGVSGAGGSTAGCNPSFCPVPSGLPLSPCCASDGSCGVVTDPIAGVLRIQGGCQSFNQPGYPNPQCQPVASPVGTLTGCCRPDGTCGTDLGMFGIGCVQSNNGGNGISYCGVPPPGTGGVTGTGDGGSSIEACVNNAHSDCERCACQSCGDSLGPCFQDVGCPLILQCANQTGCTGIDCYAPNTCQTIIDTYGGITGTSVSLALPLFQCARGCGCGFAPL